LRTEDESGGEIGIGPNSKSKILIHCINFFPEPIGCGKYSGELAFSLAKNGHRVEVVTAPPHYPGWAVNAPYKFWRFQRETIKGVAVQRCPILAKRNGGGVWRALAPLSFAVFAAPLVFWRILVSRPDVLMCVEPTLFSAPAALLAGKIVGARTVLHVHDLEVDAAFEVGHIRGKWLRKAASTLERMLLRSFDLTVTISGKMGEALARKGVRPDRILVVRNWVDLGVIHPISEDEPNAFRQQLGLDRETFVTLYSGHIGAKQALDVVLEAASCCGDPKRLHFVIAGEGPAKAALVARYGNLPNVSFLPLQPPERLNELLNLADLHVLPQAKHAADLVLPSKLGGMLASGKPIVATVEAGTELAHILEGSALLVPAGDTKALVAAVRAAACADLRPMAERGRRLAASLSHKHILPIFETALIGPIRSA
jgi:colanic acid biosynthesis glycosyl transferase WcaI